MCLNFTLRVHCLSCVCVCSVGSGLCDELITRSDESYRVCVGVCACVCVWVCVYVCVCVCEF